MRENFYDLEPWNSFQIHASLRFWIAARYTEYSGYFRTRFWTTTCSRRTTLHILQHFKKIGILFSGIEAWYYWNYKETRVKWKQNCSIRQCFCPISKVESYWWNLFSQWYDGLSGEGDDAEGRHGRVPDGTEKIRRNLGETGDHHHQRNDGRRRTSTNGPVELSVRAVRERHRVTRTRATTCRQYVCDRLERVHSQQGSRQERTERIIDVASWNRSWWMDEWQKRWRRTGRR